MDLGLAMMGINQTNSGIETLPPLQK
jgi:hypothetical protein